MGLLKVPFGFVLLYWKRNVFIFSLINKEKIALIGGGEDE